MRTRTWLWSTALIVALPAALFAAGCGDTTAQGGGGHGGGNNGGEGGTGGAGGVASGNDTCDTATTVNVAQGEQTFVQGTVEGASDDYKAFCADSETMPALAYPDVVFNAQIQEDCVASLTLEGGADFDGVLVVGLAECGVDDYCSNKSTSDPESLVIDLPQGNYPVIVSNAGGGDGTFTLGIACAPRACGDHTLSPGEQCDDGNTATGDGCDASCKTEMPDPDLDTCAGAESTVGTPIDVGEVIHLPTSGGPASTVGATDSGTSNCQIAQVVPAPDNIYKVIPQSNGLLHARIGQDENDMPYCAAVNPDPAVPGCWDRAVHIRRSQCTDDTDPPASQVACSDNADDWSAVEEASAVVVGGDTYYVFVDGYNGDQYGSGLYILRLELEP